MSSKGVLSLKPGLGAFSICCALFQSVQGISLQVNKSCGNFSSPLMYGFMFEDISHSGDGGLYGQMLQNNGLEGTSPDLTAWGAVGDATIAIDYDNPLTTAIPHALRLNVASGTTGTVGVTNTGYWEFPWMEGDISGNITASLVGNEKAPDGDVYFELSLDGADVAGSSIYFGLVQLFPTTNKNRYDDFSRLLTVGASFLRFPGGNNLEGESLDNRWKWNETIGPVQDRLGREGTWSYYNTDGLDMVLSPLLAIWAGFALDVGAGTPLTGDALTPYVDDVLNELEYVLGDSSTTYGAIRAANGRKEPWNVTLVEIGNEDNLGGGCASYADTNDASCLPSPMPSGAMMDYHDYNTPDGLVAQFDYFDNVDRSNSILVGEYARNDVEYPIMQGAVGEAVFMMGMERNSDLIKMASYAPLLQLVNSSQWTPNLIPFTQSPDNVVETKSYYVQQMFSVNHGDTIKEVTSDSVFGPVYWVAFSASDSSYFFKLANYGSEIQDLSVSISGLSTAKLTVVGDDDPNAANTPEESPVVPVESTLSSSNGTFTFTLPAWSVAVLAAS
ncbi:hypothetical protein N7488_007258 [Penicillium malachiteum]|nr:hypothetical protein N7488_007258 [Penicillium malachiteum]